MWSAGFASFHPCAPLHLWCDERGIASRSAITTIAFPTSDAMHEVILPYYCKYEWNLFRDWRETYCHPLPGQFTRFTILWATNFGFSSLSHTCPLTQNHTVAIWAKIRRGINPQIWISSLVLQIIRYQLETYAFPNHWHWLKIYKQSFVLAHCTM